MSRRQASLKNLKKAWKNSQTPEAQAKRTASLRKTFARKRAEKNLSAVVPAGAVEIPLDMIPDSPSKRTYTKSGQVKNGATAIALAGELIVAVTNALLNRR